MSRVQAWAAEYTRGLPPSKVEVRRIGVRFRRVKSPIRPGWVGSRACSFAVPAGAISFGTVSDLLNLCRSLSETVFEPGEPIIVQGDPDPKLVILKEGKVEVLRDDLCVATSEAPGAIFGEISVILRTPHSATVKAQSRAVCHVISDPDAFLWQNAEVHFELMRVLAERLVAVNDHLVEISRRSEAQDEVIERIVRRIEASLHGNGDAQ